MFAFMCSGHDHGSGRTAPFVELSSESTSGNFVPDEDVSFPDAAVSTNPTQSGRLCNTWKPEPASSGSVSRLYPPSQSEAEFNSDSDEGRHTTRDLPPPGPQGEFYLELATSTRSPSNSLLTRPSGGEHPIDVEFTSVTKSFATVTGTVVGSSSDPSRTFQCHASTSNHHLDNPSPTATANSQPGDIYTHVKASTSGRGGTQVWIFTESSTWDDISDLWQECKLLIHPQYSDQVLSRKYDGTPNWIPRTLAVANAGGVNL
ncbi:hypothetical protein C8F04DRAFT_1262645 [Mycena alexandri]|uniref:Uncharacterized protein n=1 Tax=Mycena alexandri TaxID=1745969 RepID=A0AAD6SQZ5_9AGAR|nr:hypothetical protein C8F04DRAFT_1262645 [Mycena alexandri]